MTYEPWAEGSSLIRFEYTLEKNEDPELSQPVTFDLSRVFPGAFKFAELNLAANQWIGDVNRLQFKKADGEKPAEAETVGETILANLEITLGPMQIRTFIMSPIVEPYATVPLPIVHFGSANFPYLLFSPFVILMLLLVWRLGKKYRICSVFNSRSNSIPHEKLKPLSFAE